MYDDPLHPVVHSTDLRVLAEVVAAQPHQVQAVAGPELGDAVGRGEDQPLSYERSSTEPVAVTIGQSGTQGSHPGQRLLPGLLPANNLQGLKYFQNISVKYFWFKITSYKLVGVEVDQLQ